MRNTVLRRLDLLKMEGEGFSYSDIVKGLSKQYDCSERTVKYDFALRGEWQPKLSGVTETNKIIMKAANRYAWIYAMAAFKQRHAQKELVEIAALNTMLKANEKWLDTLVPNLHSKEDLGTDTRPFVIRKWRREDAKATDA